MLDSVDNGCVSVPSIPPPRPKSPPEYPDLYGKRREFAKVQMLEREIGFLEEELKYVEGLQPASRYCKEITDFVTGNSDPLIPTTKKARRSCRFWKWLCGSSCFKISWTCCCFRCPHLEMPHCCDCDCNCNCNCNLCNFNPCISCSMPKCHCRCSMPKCHCHCSCLNSKCFHMPDCSPHCCIPKCPSCSLRWCCRRCTCFYPKCPKVKFCCCCKKRCCYSCYVC